MNLQNNKTVAEDVVTGREALADLPVIDDGQIKGGNDSLGFGGNDSDRSGTSQGVSRVGTGTIVLGNSNHF